MDIKLADRIALTTEHAASSYGIPVLVIDGQAYGPADYGRALRQALYDPNDILNWLEDCYTDEQLLLNLCYDNPEARDALRKFRIAEID